MYNRKQLDSTRMVVRTLNSPNNPMFLAFTSPIMLRAPRVYCAFWIPRRMTGCSIVFGSHRVCVRRTRRGGCTSDL
jgi:hypothetical protein